MEEKRKRIFITGGTGLLGHHLIQMAPAVYDIDCSYFPLEKKDAIPYDCGKHYLDIRRAAPALKLIRALRPDYVINTASIASVDLVENNKDEAMRTNLGGTQNILNACQDIGARLIYISSNAVFDGENPPYSEDDALNPLNYYGKLKVEEERLFQGSGVSGAIVRPILMYGWNLSTERKNPVTWLKAILEKGQEVHMVDDIYCNPLFVKDCADVIWKIIEQGRGGIFHAGGEDELSRYEFACITAEAFGFDPGLIKPVRNSFFGGIAPRPCNTTYNIDKIKRELGLFPLGAKSGLLAMKEARVGIT